jgi:ATP-binding cassette subfamily F protein uup
MSYLQDFLFGPERARTPVKALSGGERNRLLLARLFAQPANLLVLDEPTNDLDIETLELLEALLVDYPGTILLVSHDRAFLDNVVTQTLVFESGGRVQEYVGGYSDWLRQRKLPEPQSASAPAAAAMRTARRAATKLSYKDERELAALPAAIEALEAEQAELAARVSEPEFWRGAAAEQARVQQRLAALPAQIEQAYARWAELEAQRERARSST